MPVAKKVAKKKVVKEKVEAPAPNVRACTEQDLIDNPEWRGSINVGDMIEAPVAPVVEEVVEAPKASRKAKASGYAIVTKGSEYIRTYEDKDVAEGFVAKNPQFLMIDASEITELSVSFDVLNPKTGVISQASEQFSFAKNGEQWKEAAIRFKNDNRGTCTYK